MTTTMLVAGKKRKATIQEKALRIRVFNHEPGVLAAVSDSDSRIRYALVLTADGRHIASCACTHCKVPSNPTPCAYRLAGELHLKQQRYDQYCAMYGTVDFYGC